MMLRLRTHKSAVFLCIAVVVVAALVPAGSSLFDAILTPLWLLFPSAAVVVIRRTAARSDDQPASLLSLIPARAPPAMLALA